VHRINGDLAGDGRLTSSWQEEPLLPNVMSSTETPR